MAIVPPSLGNGDTNCTRAHRAVMVDVPMLPKLLLAPILDNDALTRGLGDAEARMLVEWLVEEADRRATGADAEEAAVREVPALVPLGAEHQQVRAALVLPRSATRPRCSWQRPNAISGLCPRPGWSHASSWNASWPGKLARPPIAKAAKRGRSPFPMIVRSHVGATRRQLNFFVTGNPSGLPMHA